MNRIHATKFMVFVVILSFVITYFIPLGTILAAQPEDEIVVHPMHVSQLANSFVSAGYSPSQIRTAYGLPSSGGAGATIAIIDAYDTPSITNDLTVFSNQSNLPLPTANNFEIHKMSANLGTDNNWALEACLDVEWAHAIAPEATILLVETASSSSNDLLSAVNYARSQPGVVAVSMSWGGSEFSSESAYNQDFNSTSGIVFFASSGDNGAGVIWPSSSPNVVAVGGTTLRLNSGGSVFSETAWSESGGGVSAYEAIPAYQTSYGLTNSGRSVPDVSYNANPATGFAVYCDSSWYKVGGTSAGAPQWAAIQALGLSATNANLYEDAKLVYTSYFRDITSGSNGGYNATIGYDCVTGVR
ncbi:MAG: S53 family peptidase [Candidatus Bathyarchaeia archaeon]